MCDKLEERKQAMLMYHVHHLSKAEICRRLKRSRPWLDCWLARYDPGRKLSRQDVLQVAAATPYDREEKAAKVGRRGPEPSHGCRIDPSSTIYDLAAF